MKYTNDFLVEAHRKSGWHRQEVLSSDICGCFYCKEQFPPSKIIEWVDEDDNGVGLTAICPVCGIDSVIGAKSGFPISDMIFLSEMHNHYF